MLIAFTQQSTTKSNATTESDTDNSAFVIIIFIGSKEGEARNLSK